MPHECTCNKFYVLCRVVIFEPLEHCYLVVRTRLNFIAIMQLKRPIIGVFERPDLKVGHQNSPSPGKYTNSVTHSLKSDNVLVYGYLIVYPFVFDVVQQAFASVNLSHLVKRL